MVEANRRQRGARAAPRRLPGEGRRRPLGLYLVVAFTIIVSFFPTIWLFFTSIKTKADIYAWPVQFWPSPATLENYLAIWRDTPELLRYIFNSFIVASATTFVTLAFGGLAAYSLARFRYRGRNIVLFGILAVSMFPPLALLPSLFDLFLEVGLLNTYPALTLAHTGLYLPMAVWILSNFYKTIPFELEDAARIDGASSLRIFWNIILPLSTPGLIATGLIVFIMSWVVERGLVSF